jgi:hypothetical protein
MGYFYFVFPCDEHFFLTAFLLMSIVLDFRPKKERDLWSFVSHTDEGKVWFALLTFQSQFLHAIVKWSPNIVCKVKPQGEGILKIRGLGTSNSKMWPHISEMFLTYKLLPILKHDMKVIKNLKYTGGRGSLGICLRSLSLLRSGCNLFTMMDVLGYKVPSKHTSNFLHMLYEIVKPCQFFLKCILRLCYKAEYDYRAFWKTE